MNGQEFLIGLQEQADNLKLMGAQFASDLEEWLLSVRPPVLAINNDDIIFSDQAYQMDLALLKAAPLMAVPKFSEFDPLYENGHRFLLAADGLYLEVRRPWLHFIHRLVEQPIVAMPYGQVQPRTELAFERLGNVLGLIRSFAQAAKREAPNEWADMLVWNATDKSMSDLNVAIVDVTPGSVRYECRPLEDHESVAIDLHSHGHLPAFFSDTDNQDDAGSVKISGVIGNLDSPTPTCAFRLCVLGLYLPIAVPAAAIFCEE